MKSNADRPGRNKLSLSRQEYAVRRQHIGDMWRAGLRSPEIADRMGMTSQQVTRLVGKWRNLGDELPRRWIRIEDLADQFGAIEP